jgi:hypothetical protein
MHGHGLTDVPIESGKPGIAERHVCEEWRVDEHYLYRFMPGSGRPAASSLHKLVTIFDDPS